jgi:hypothetical protein
MSTYDKTAFGGESRHGAGAEAPRTFDAAKKSGVDGGLPDFSGSTKQHFGYWGAGMKLPRNMLASNACA